MNVTDVQQCPASNSRVRKLAGAIKRRQVSGTHTKVETFAARKRRGHR